MFGRMCGRKEHRDGIAKKRPGICRNSASGALSAGRRNADCLRIKKHIAVCGRFSHDPACNYAVRATIYDKTKIGCPFGHPIFVVRSTGIEAVSKTLKAFIYKAFSHLLAKNTPIILGLRDSNF